MLTNYLEFWTKITVFNATATRSQYWTAYIANAIIIWLYALASGELWAFRGDFSHLGASLNSLFFILLLILDWIANFTIRARRLHDSDHSNWWLLITVVPVIGNLWLFVLLLMPTIDNQRWPLNQSQVQ
ncbi:DUF805 domain-containing protein [Secundilactobacillus folii]|nr:DUF805 domain-containing protein [Secundilactobacillus folii]